MADWVISALVGIVAGFAAALGVMFWVRNRKITVSDDVKRMFDSYSMLVRSYGTTVSRWNILAKAKTVEAEHAGDAGMLAEISVLTDQMRRDKSEFESWASKVSVDYGTRKKNDPKMLSEALEHMETANDGMSFAADSLEAVSPAKKEESAPKRTAPAYRELMDIPFFYGCTNENERNARFRALAKALHPDAKSGCPDLFKVLNLQYKNKR